MTAEDARRLLHAACREVGLDATNAELIRAAENSLFRLPGQIVARVTRTGQVEAARKEVCVSRWLHGLGVAVVEVLADIEQPVEAEGRAVTFLRELPTHRHGTTAELADLLRQLHALPTPDFGLPSLAPFVRLGQRIEEATGLASDDRSWLLDQLATLRTRYDSLPSGRPWVRRPRRRLGRERGGNGRRPRAA